MSEFRSRTDPRQDDAEQLLVDRIDRLRTAAANYEMACEVGEPWQVTAARREFELRCSPTTILAVLDALRVASSVTVLGSSPSTDPRPDDAEHYITPEVRFIPAWLRAGRPPWTCPLCRGCGMRGPEGGFCPTCNGEGFVDPPRLAVEIAEYIDELASGSATVTERARQVRAAYDECAGCGFMRQEHVVRGNGTTVVKTWDGDRADWRYVPCDGFRGVSP